MALTFAKYKGIHPGLILEHELRKRGVSKRQFAISIGEHPQTFNAITKGRRKIPTELSFQIDEALKLQQGTMLLMQTYYEIEEHRKCVGSVPEGFEKLRKALFWDTDFNKIDWNKQAEAIIKRVFERGNDAEKKTIEEYYDKNLVKKVLTH